MECMDRIGMLMLIVWMLSLVVVIGLIVEL